MPKSAPLVANAGIARAVRIAGGQVALAAKLNAGRHGDRQSISQQAISEWCRKGYVPVNRALEISECVDSRVPPADLIEPALKQILLTMISPARV